MTKNGYSTVNDSESQSLVCKSPPSWRNDVAFDFIAPFCVGTTLIMTFCLAVLARVDTNDAYVIGANSWVTATIIFSILLWAEAGFWSAWSYLHTQSFETYVRVTRQNNPGWIHNKETEAMRLLWTRDRMVSGVVGLTVFALAIYYISMLSDSIYLYVYCKDNNIDELNVTFDQSASLSWLESRKLDMLSSVQKSFLCSSFFSVVYLYVTYMNPKNSKDV
jgi:hypothetical protein